MAQQLKTLLNRTYEVQTPETCTVTNSDGTTILTAYAGVPVQFTADGKEVILSADSALLRLVEGKSYVAITETGSGGSYMSGEEVMTLSAPEFTMKHATWFENSTHASIVVKPAEWKGKVMTSYLKTMVPVSLSGVQWLYDEPFMMEGATYVVALQQVDEELIVANLAYVVPTLV